MHNVFMHNKKHMLRGFTLLEMLIVIAIFAVIAASGVGYYRNYTKNVGLEGTRDQMIFALKEARAKSSLGEAGSGDVSLAWGVRVVNGVNDYYELYSTPTSYSSASTSIQSTVSLDTGVIFTDPAQNLVKDILFQKVTGSTTPTTITFLAEGRAITVTVTSLGVIY